MGAPTGNWLHDSAREITEMASMQFAVYGLMNPRTYQRPKITPLPDETGLTVPGGTGVAVVPNGTAPAVKPPYLPGQYSEYPAAVQGWAQQALPGGGSSIAEYPAAVQGWAQQALPGGGSSIEGGTSTVQKVFTDNPFDEGGNLKPNIKYQTGEFKYNYETDANGRISNWNTDNLQLTERDGRLNYNSDSPGKIEGDHAGHLAGDRFGGSPELDNIVSQSQNVNLSQYKKIENQWAKAISEGKEVTVNVDIKYDGDGLRPIEFNVEYTIDGDFFSQSILN